MAIELFRKVSSLTTLRGRVAMYHARKNRLLRGTETAFQDTLDVRWNTIAEISDTLDVRWDIQLDNLSPDVLQVQTNLTGAVTDIDEDPDIDDGNWLTAPNDVITTCRVSFPTPSSAPMTGAGMQEFKIRVRETEINNSQTQDSVEIFLFEGGSQIGARLVIENDLLGDPGEIVSGFWDAGDLATADGSDVECHIVGNPENQGTPSTRGSIEIGAIEWIVK